VAFAVLAVRGVIRIFFDSVVVVDNPNALIRIYPKVLESVCKDAEASDGRAYRVSPRGLVAGMKLENVTMLGGNVSISSDNSTELKYLY